MSGNTEYKMTPEELEAFLEKHDFSNENFANLIGVDKQTIQTWLRGTRKIPATTCLLIRYFDQNPTRMRDF